ncbi:MAG TPA: cytochrome ubiquinol oxidase subunit I [Stenomitos sp.]
MDDPLLIARWQFAFTVTYHYLFPQLTMGLSLLIFVLKTMSMRTQNELYNTAARFWAKIFAVNFVIGVVTGIPMEFQFGTNWAKFSAFAGGIIAQTLAMEGAFAFFLESAFLGLFLYGERRISQRMHWFSSLMVFLGTWASGWFIIVTNAWMQAPTGHKVLPNGGVDLANYWALLLNPWAFIQFLHNESAAVVTASFVMAGLGAFYLLSKQHVAYARVFVRIGVIAGLISSLCQLWPSGDWEGRQVTHKQPIKLAAMEGLFQTERGAGIVILGQPDMTNKRLDNPLVVPRALSFLTYQSWGAEIKGLDAFPQTSWPDNIPLLYYSYHIMVGLGTIFIAVMAVSALPLWRRKLYDTGWMLWILMLSIPFPYIANTAGWMVTELGRQPYLVTNLFRTAAGVSPNVSSGNIWFTFLGFMGMYALLGLLFLALVLREIAHGPEYRPMAPGEAQSIS